MNCSEVHKMFRQSQRTRPFLIVSRNTAQKNITCNDRRKFKYTTSLISALSLGFLPVPSPAVHTERLPIHGLNGWVYRFGNLHLLHIFKVIFVNQNYCFCCFKCHCSLIPRCQLPRRQFPNHFSKRIITLFRHTYMCHWALMIQSCFHCSRRIRT